MADSATHPVWGNPYYQMDWGNTLWPPTRRHTQGANMAYCDGHVNWLPGTKLGIYDATNIPLAGAPDPNLWRVNNTWPLP